MIGKPYSGKPNVRFDEGELEIEPSATTPALYSTVVLKKKKINIQLSKSRAGLTPLSIFFSSVREPLGLVQDPSYQTAPVGAILSPWDIYYKFLLALRVTTYPPHRCFLHRKSPPRNALTDATFKKKAYYHSDLQKSAPHRLPVLRSPCPPCLG